MGYPKHLVIRPYSSVTTLAEERKRVTPLSTSFDIIALRLAGKAGTIPRPPRPISDVPRVR